MFGLGFRHRVGSTHRAARLVAVGGIAALTLGLTLLDVFGESLATIQAQPQGPTVLATPLPTNPPAPVARLPVPRFVEGGTYETAGYALPNVSLQLRCAGSVVASTQADADGLFEIVGVGSDPCTIEASLSDYVTQSVLLTGEPHLDITLSRSPGTLQILARDAFTGAPARNAEVVVALVRGGIVVSEGQTDASGRASLVVDPGDYAIRVSGSGYASRRVTATVGSNEDVPVAFPMSLAIQGMVVSRDTGNPIFYAWVTLYRLGPPNGAASGLSRRLEAEAFQGAGVALPELPQEIDGEMVGYTITDDRGYFWLDVPSDGQYRAVAEAEGWNVWPETTDVGNLSAAEPLLDFRLGMSRLRRRIPVVPPVRIDIPSLAVQAPVLPVGVERNGTMESPSDPDTVVWFQYGAGVGSRGNAILAGHVNWAGSPRVFGFLHEMVPGDAISITAATGEVITYRVQWSTMVDANSSVADIVRQGPLEEITLITCGGEYDTQIRQYLGRLVVRAVRDS
ncbi:MAG: class sortase [Chloroflexi bacterium]|nr:class sortase [Chloroflexota bacterium]